MAVCTRAKIRWVALVSAEVFQAMGLPTLSLTPVLFVVPISRKSTYQVTLL